MNVARDSYVSGNDIFYTDGVQPTPQIRRAMHICVFRNSQLLLTHRPPAQTILPPIVFHSIKSREPAESDGRGACPRIGQPSTFTLKEFPC